MGYTAMDAELEEFLLTSNRRAAYQNQLEFLKKEYEERSMTVINGHRFVVDLDLLKWADWAMSESEERGIDMVIVLDSNKEPVAIDDIPFFHDEVHAVFHEALNHYHEQYRRLKAAKTLKEIVDVV